MIFRKFFLISIFLLSNIFAQNASSREWTIFRKGVAEYQKGNYETARQSFSLMISKLPNSALTTANKLMLAKTNYKSGDYDVSLRQCEEFKQFYPSSDYIDDVKYLIGNNYYRQNRIETAVVTWLDAAFESGDKSLKRKILKLADDVIRYKMNRISLEELSKKHASSEINESLSFNIADNSYRNGNYSNAKILLAGLVSSAKTGYYREKAEDLLENISGTPENQIQIAALLPLSGQNEDVGKSLLSGFKLAVNEYNVGAAKKIVIVEYDYASDLVTALQQVKKISSNPAPIAIFGPVENEIVAACAAVAEYEGISVISPTASSDKIRTISQNCINLAPTVKTMARTIQTFAYDSLGIRRAATFSPIDDYYISMTDEFKTAHEEKGGIIATQEWYYPGDQNYKKQLRKMKRVGLKLAFIDSLITENPEISDSTIDSSFIVYMEEQRELLKETKTTLDSADVPVTTFDAMFMPVYVDDISYMAAQFAYANFQTQIIGNSDWYDNDALKKNRNYINGIIFVTDGYLNEEDWDYRQFRNKFRNTYKTTPAKFELIAYDSFKFISQIFNKKDVARSDVIEEIVSLKPHQGIYRNFDMDSQGANKSCRILKYIYGQIIPMR